MQKKNWETRLKFESREEFEDLWAAMNLVNLMAKAWHLIRWDEMQQTNWTRLEIPESWNLAFSCKANETPFAQIGMTVSLPSGMSLFGAKTTSSFCPGW